MHKETLNKRQSFGGIDLAKFLAALLILVYHTFSEHGPLHPLFADFLSLYAVAVALFMTISGFLTFSKLETIPDYNERWQVVSRQTKRILTIYLAWSVPYIIYQVYTWDFANITLKFILLEFRRWIFSSTFHTIWFLFSLALGLPLAFFITEKLPTWCAALVGIILYTIAALTASYLFLGNKLPFYEVWSPIFRTYLGSSRGWLVFATPLLMLGKVITKIKDKISITMAFILSIISMSFLLAEALLIRRFVGNMGIDTVFFMIPAVTFITIFCTKLTLPEGKYLVWMRKMSVLIFVTQRIFLTVITSFLPISVMNVIFANNYLGAIILCAVTIAFSALIILLSKKISWLKKIY